MLCNTVEQKMAPLKWFRRSRTRSSQRTGKSCVRKHCYVFLLIVATILGFGFGVLHKRLGSPSSEVIRLIGFPGLLVLRAFRLLIIPLLACSLVLGVSSLSARGGNAKILTVTIVFFGGLSLFSSAAGVVVGHVVSNSAFFDNGNVTNRNSDGDSSQRGLLVDSVLDLLRNAVPDNIMQATFMQEYTATYEQKEFLDEVPDIDDTNVTISPRYVKEVKYKYSVNFVGLLVCCIAVGCAMASLKDEVNQLRLIISQLNMVVTKILMFIIKLLPIGLFFWMYQQGLEVETGSDIFRKVGIFWGVAAVCLLLHQLALLPILYVAIVRRNPFTFHMKLLPAIFLAFGTSSSAATLPVTLRCMETSHVRHSVTSFVVPLGVAVHMNGGSFFMSMAAVFISRLEGIELTIVQSVIVCFVVFLLLIAAPGTPSSGSPVLFLAVLSAIGNDNPLHLYLVMVMDWLLERLRTSSNIVGDCYVAAFVDKLCCDSNRSAVEPSDPDDSDSQLDEVHLNSTDADKKESKTNSEVDITRL